MDASSRSPWQPPLVRRGWFLLGSALVLVCLVGCDKSGSGPAGSSESGGGPSAGAFPLTSPAISPGAPIPRKFAYRGAGQNVSPELAWTDPPAGTKEFALIVDDPDAPNGTWTHWVLYKIPAAARSLAEGTGRGAGGGGMVQGLNSWNEVGYGGPMPPAGERHRYFFRLYALDTELAPKANQTARQLREAMAGHILGTAELMGTFQQ